MSKRMTKAQLELELEAERLARHIAEEQVAELDAERLARRAAEERVAELEAEVERAYHTVNTVESGAAAATEEAEQQPVVDRDIIADVRAKFRMDGTKVLNVCFVDQPVEGGDLARALGRGLTWIAPEPRQDRHGRWWTNCIATDDARRASANQYYDRALPPIGAYEDA